MSDIHDLFHSAAPAQPPTEGWAEKARAKRARNSARVGGIAAVVVLAVATPLAVDLVGQGGATVGSQSVTDTAGSEPEAGFAEDGAAQPEPGAGDAGTEYADECSIDPTPPAAGLAEVTAATLCRADGTRMVLSSEQTAEILGEVRVAGPVPAGHQRPDDLTGRRLVLLTPFSEALVLTELKEGEFEFLVDGEPHLFRASPTLIEALRPEE